MGGLGVSQDKAEQFADSNIRRQMVELLEEAREMDRKALSYIKEAL